AMLETPFVLLNVQRGGPSTGLPTQAGQGDMMQSRWGSHGDYEIIAIAPDSPQEMFDYTIKAFNLAEKYRCPVMIMADECVGHMTEKVVVPTAEEIEVEPRRFYQGAKDKYQPYKPGKDLVPPMAKAGDGLKLHISGLTHDENGHPVYDQEFASKRLIDKILLNADEIIELKEEGIEDVDVVVISYGITSRVAIKGIEIARENGIKVGNLRLITVWPFPEKRIAELSQKVKAFVVPEINYGQIVYEVDRCSKGNANVVLVPHGGGFVHDPEDIYEAIKYAYEEQNKIDKIVEHKTKLYTKIKEKGFRVY
ncbi:MAG: 2-oxoacid:acceptor oxidoreductase subunit alpha, partial [Candidatus Cloacimonetes bacterium]|nr:2-oxoacid:acceptor oxidoreductase subunit alpha [Candidatus Cloacimonadota bacterium]